MEPRSTAVNAPASGFFAKLRGRLKLPALLGGRVDETMLEELESQLLMGDVGVEASRRIIQDLRRDAAEISDAAALRAALQRSLATILAPVAQPLVLPAAPKPFVLLALGVNGVG